MQLATSRGRALYSSACEDEATINYRDNMQDCLALATGIRTPNSHGILVSALLPIPIPLRLLLLLLPLPLLPLLLLLLLHGPTPAHSCAFACVCASSFLRLLLLFCCCFCCYSYNASAIDHDLCNYSALTTTPAATPTSTARTTIRVGTMPICDNDRSC